MNSFSSFLSAVGIGLFFTVASTIQAVRRWHGKPDVPDVNELNPYEVGVGLFLNQLFRMLTVIPAFCGAVTLLVINRYFIDNSHGVERSALWAPFVALCAVLVIVAVLMVSLYASGTPIRLVPPMYRDR
jgi:hypothetical protein